MQRVTSSSVRSDAEAAYRLLHLRQVDIHVCEAAVRSMQCSAASVQPDSKQQGWSSAPLHRMYSTRPPSMRSRWEEEYSASSVRNTCRPARQVERWRAVTCACPCLAASLGVRSPDASQHTHSSTGRHSAACCRHGARPRTCIAEVSAGSQLVFLSYCCAAPSLLRPLHGAQQQQHWQSYPALSCILLYGWHDKRVAAEQGLSPVSSCLAALCVCSVACCAGQGLETSLAVGPYLIGRQAGVLQEEGFLAAVRLSASCVSTLLAAQLLLLVE